MTYTVVTSACSGIRYANVLELAKPGSNTHRKNVHVRVVLTN